MFFESFKAKGGAAAATKDWGAVAANVPGRDAAMCEALFKLNRSFLSLPIDAINGVALSAMMNDHYNNIVALRESTPERDEKAPQSNGGRGGPAATPGSGRVVGKRTPRSNPGKKTAAAVEKDVLEMAGAALVSMSPGGAVASGLAFAGARSPSPARRKKVKEEEDHFDRPFGSPSPSPGRRRGEKKGRALFHENAGKKSNGAIAEDDEAMGALDGLFMLADASTLAEGDKKKRKAAGGASGRPPRPTPNASPARRGKGGVASTAHRKDAALATRDGISLGLVDGFRSPSHSTYGAHTPGTSRKTILKSTPPVRLRDGVSGGGFYRAPTTATEIAGRGARGIAFLARGLGLIGPRHVDVDDFDEVIEEQRPPGSSTPATPSLLVQTGVHRGAPSAARRRWFLAEHFYSSMDKPWFVPEGYGKFLRHVGLGDRVKFTREEWTEIRRALGTPRRLSLPFLRQERIRLERWRIHVRNSWMNTAGEAKATGEPKKEQNDDAAPMGVAAVAAEIDEEKAAKRAASDAKGAPAEDAGAPVPVTQAPDDFPAPFRVGDRVAARHPRVLNVNTGSVLTVQNRVCRVQFDRQELGVELVRDIAIAHLPLHLDSRLLEEEEEMEAEEREAAANDAATREWILHGSPVPGKQTDVALPADGQTVAGRAISAAAATTSAAGGDGLADSEALAAEAAAAAAEAAASAMADATKAASLLARNAEEGRLVFSLVGDLIAGAPETTAAIEAATRIAERGPGVSNGRAEAAEARAEGTNAPGQEGSGALNSNVDDDPIAAHEEGVRALAEVTRALDVKETLVSEIRAMNDLAAEKRRAAEEADAADEDHLTGGTVLEPFQRQYASTMLKVRENNARLHASLVKLRELHARRTEVKDMSPSRPASSLTKDSASDEGMPMSHEDGDEYPVEAAGKLIARPRSDAPFDAAAEIVAASSFTAACRFVRSDTAEVRSSPASLDALKARMVGSVIAVKACADHGADATLISEVIERFLTSIENASGGGSDETAPAMAELKAAFSELEAEIVATRISRQAGNTWV